MRRTALSLLLAATLIACGGSTGDGTTIELTAADSGSARPAKVGDDIVVSLEANPTTGYSWQLAPGLDKLSWEGDAPVMPDANGRYPIAVPGQTQVL